MAKGHPKLKKFEIESVTMTERKSGVINKEEVEAHKAKLTGIVSAFIDKIKTASSTDETPHYLNFLKELKKVCSEGYKDIEQANVHKVLNSIKDVTCNVIRDPDMSPRARVFESKQEVPEGQDVMRTVGGKWTNETREILYETFECLGEAHANASTACHRLARLSRTISAEQFVAIAKIAVQPFITLQMPEAEQTVSTAGSASEAETFNKRLDRECVPLPNRDKWAKEPNTATTLLACVTYYIVRRAVMRIGTYEEAAQGFGVKISRLRSCVTAAKYEGGPRVQLKRTPTQPGQVLGTAVKIEPEHLVVQDSSTSEDEGEKTTVEQDANVTTTKGRGSAKKLSRKQSKQTKAKPSASKRKQSLIRQELEEGDDDNGDEPKRKQKRK